MSLLTTLRRPLVALLTACSALAQGTPREANWREDIRFLVAGLSASGTTIDLQRGPSSRGQKDFSRLYPKAVFDAGIERLEESLPALSDAEIVLSLMRLIASANVAHNLVQIPLGMGFFSRLPLTFQWYADGLAVTSAAAGLSSTIGARVLSIGAMTPEQLLTSVAPYISHENDVWLRANAPEFIRARAVLQHFNLSGQDGAVLLTLQKPGGTPYTVSIAPADPQTKRISFREALQGPVPLFRTNPKKYYWYQYLEDTRTLYVQYNVCRSDPKQPFPDFAREALSQADSNRPQRVVIDLRLNGGGDSRVIGPLRRGLRSRLDRIGPVSVLIGPATFSSGLDNAIELRQTLHATLVGEPTGGKPSGYGEIKFLTLPHSKLVVQFTSKRFGTPKEPDTPALQPDIAAPFRITDALAGRDPALEAAISAVR